MGKKKKKSAALDARGYQQGGGATRTVPAPETTLPVPIKPTRMPPPSLLSAPSPSSFLLSPSSITLSASTTDRIHHLLETIPRPMDPRSTPLLSTSPPDRLDKSLAKLHDQLTALGIAFIHQQACVKALGYSATTSLEVALDWLCFSLSASDLPPRFTEGKLRNEKEEQEKAATSHSIEVVVVPMVARHGKDKDKNNNDKPERFVLDTRQAIEINNKVDSIESDNQQETAVASEQRAWLLEQYAYVPSDDDDGDENEEDKDVVEENGMNVLVGDFEKEKASEPSSTDDDGAANGKTTQQEGKTAASSLDELALISLEQSLAESESDLANEASNYMRSKAEIKELQRKVKQLRHQLQGLRRKSAKANKKEVPLRPPDETVAPAHDLSVKDIIREEVDLSDGLGLEGMFAVDDAALSKKPNFPSINADNAIENERMIPLDSIPPSWTGQTPWQILEEFCRKEKISRPTVAKRSNKVFLLHVPLKPGPLEVITPSAPSLIDAKQFAATKALYQINPDRPLYLILPPFHRDLWNEWTAAKKAEQQYAVDESMADRQGRIDSLLACMAESAAKQPLLSTVGSGNGIPAPLMDNSSKKEKSHANRKTTRQSSDATNARLKADFVSRVASAPYRQMLEERRQLPMYKYRQEVLDVVRAHPVTIVSADTGAGKSTQCPAFLLHEGLLDDPGKVSILCTQPRRIAAVSVAERVAEELCEPAVGRLVGYQIRLEGRRSEETRLLFCTTGVVLRRLQEDPTLEGVSHVILDEVHERQWQTDMLLVALRGLLESRRPDLKLVLMSATLDADLFGSFFGGAPLIKVPGRMFPVATYYLEDLLEATNHVIAEDSWNAQRRYASNTSASLQVTGKGGVKRREKVWLDTELGNEVSDNYSDYSMATRLSMDRVNDAIINYDLIEDILQQTLLEGDYTSLRVPEGADLSYGACLIFLPGLGEIRSLSDRLRAHRVLGDPARFNVIPMHSSLSSKDQRRAFAKPQGGCRNIIVSTNIAETSVTIPDVVIVIDSGRVREIRQDKLSPTTTKLIEDWCSRASAKQRAGRAGRVQPGLCLKLYSSRTESTVMLASGTPEIKRIALEEVCLHILAAGLAANCASFLAQMPQPPEDVAIQAALALLEQIGAIRRVSCTSSWTAFAEEQELTPLGRHLAKLPVDCRLGKMLVLGCLFQCLDPIATIVASLAASQSQFLSTWDDQTSAKAIQASFGHEHSDFMTFCNVWEAFDRAEQAGDTRSFCRKHYLNYVALCEIKDAKRQFLDLLAGTGLLERTGPTTSHNNHHKKEMHVRSRPNNANASNEALIHFVIVASLYPNVARLEASSSNRTALPQLWHKKTEILYIHPSSVNRRLYNNNSKSDLWLAFAEKFGTLHRVSISTTCVLSHPGAMVLMGGDGSVEVLHVHRKVILDDCIELPMAATTGVLLKELRKLMNYVLLARLESNSDDRNARRNMELLVECVVDLLA